ncbi:MAG: hypothetical protein ABEI27_12825 [Halobellus sp.]
MRSPHTTAGAYRSGVVAPVRTGRSIGVENASLDVASRIIVGAS